MTFLFANLPLNHPVPPLEQFVDCYAGRYRPTSRQGQARRLKWRIIFGSKQHAGISLAGLLGFNIQQGAKASSR